LKWEASLCPSAKQRQKNHEEYSPESYINARSPIPNIIEVFDNFAVMNCFSYRNLDAGTRPVVIPASLIAQQTLSGI